MTKTIEQNFADWEGGVFGFGYGTGEEHYLPALKTFLESVGRPEMPHAYEYEVLEKAVGATVAWLLICMLCRANIIEYGTSPRYGWLTEEGQNLRVFVASKTAEELYEICCNRSEDDDPGPCYPDACNCGPRGYQEGVKCPNPFWKGHHD